MATISRTRTRTINLNDRPQEEPTPKRQRKMKEPQQETPLGPEGGPITRTEHRGVTRVLDRGGVGGKSFDLTPALLEKLRAAAGRIVVPAGFAPFHLLPPPSLPPVAPAVFPPLGRLRRGTGFRFDGGSGCSMRLRTSETLLVPAPLFRIPCSPPYISASAPHAAPSLPIHFSFQRFDRARKRSSPNLLRLPHPPVGRLLAEVLNPDKTPRPPPLTRRSSRSSFLALPRAAIPVASRRSPCAVAAR